MSNYLFAPVEGVDLLGWFKFDRERSERQEPTFTSEHAMQLAQVVNAAIEVGHSAVWFNPETDSRAVRVHNRPVELGGRALRFASPDEVAVFPRPNPTAA